MRFTLRTASLAVREIWILCHWFSVSGKSLLCKWCILLIQGYIYGAMTIMMMESQYCFGDVVVVRWEENRKRQRGNDDNENYIWLFYLLFITFQDETFDRVSPLKRKKIDREELWLTFPAIFAPLFKTNSLTLMLPDHFLSRRWIRQIPCLNTTKYSLRIRGGHCTVVVHLLVVVLELPLKRREIFPGKHIFFLCNFHFFIIIQFYSSLFSH